MGTVQGQPALVIWPNTDPMGPNPAFVEWVSGSTDVQISSDAYSVDQLLAIAGGMS